MQQPYLLPGASPATRRKSSLAPLFVIVFLTVFSGVGYVIWSRLTPTHDAPPPATQIEKSQPAPASATEPLMEDLNIHFQNAIRSTVRASELSRRSQRRIREVMPAVERDYLDVSRRRLEAADSLAEQAIRECNRASEELQIAQQLTQQQINKGGK